MTPADWHDLTTAGCVIGVLVVVALILGWALGWIEGSLSLRIVPPWKRKAAEPKPKTLTTSDETHAAVPLNRKAG